MMRAEVRRNGFEEKRSLNADEDARDFPIKPGEPSMNGNVNDSPLPSGDFRTRQWIIPPLIGIRIAYVPSNMHIIRVEDARQPFAFTSGGASLHETLTRLHTWYRGKAV